LQIHVILHLLSKIHKNKKVAFGSYTSTSWGWRDPLAWSWQLGTLATTYELHHSSERSA
jgi:hypothetical protein